MSKVDRLLGKPIDKEIGGEVWTIHPMGIEDVGLVLELENKDSKIAVAAMKKIVFDTIQKADPEASPEKIGKIGLKYFRQFKEAIDEVNGLTIPEDVDKGPSPKS